MGKTFKKISGMWKPVKKVFIKVSGNWLEAKKVFKKVSGNWQNVHLSTAEYTFQSNLISTTMDGLLLSNYVNPTSADVFNIYINTGVTVSGMQGIKGNDGTPGGVYYVGNCHTVPYSNMIHPDYSGGNGGTGGTGGYGINFAGFGGKTINIINSGILKGGNGGTGGNGGPAYTTCIGTNGCGGAGGAGGQPYNNITNVVINVSGNLPSVGNTGATGGVNLPTLTFCNCNCDCAG